MTLSINVGVVDGNAANNCERENESPHVSSRKSPRLSLSSSPSAHRGGPLSDVHSKISNSPRREESSKSSSSTSTPSKQKSALPPTYANYAGSNNSNNRFISSANKFKPRGPSKDDIEATDDKQASVNQLSHWLSESAKKNRKPPIHHRTAGSSQHITTPIRFATKPRINKADVEATDDKRVSVKTLSSWMSDDPFQQKKVRTIRSGTKVIAKSRIFEKDQNVKISDCNIKMGSVEERQAWLSEAFRHESDDVVKPQMLSEKKVRPFQPKKKTVASPEMELKSVSEKKEWLSKAFKNNNKDGDNSPAIIHQTKSFEVNHEDEIPDIHHTKSFEVHDVYPTKSFEASLQDARKSIMNPSINQTKSFEVNGVYPTKSFEVQLQDSKKSIMKPSRTMSHHPINHTNSYDGGMSGSKSHTTNTFEKQQSVVRLYQNNDKDDEESPEKALKSVHDKQAWLSNAFKKPTGGNTVSGHAGSSPVVKEVKNKSNGVEHVQVNVEEVSTVVMNVGKSKIDNEKSAPTAKYKVSSSDKPDIDSMTVAERARWLKGAFK